ncbi:MAG: hydrogenase maturation protease [bacterium JZ-2024 1]
MNRRLLLLGLGNEIRSDDAVGILIVRQIRKKLQQLTSNSEPESNAFLSKIEIKESEEMGLALLDYIAGYDEVVLVDAVQTGKAPPGFVHELDVENLKALPGLSPHYLGISEVLALGKTSGLEMPEKVKIFAVEVKDPFTFGTCLTPEVEHAIPEVVERILQYLSGAGIIKNDLGVKKE